MFEGVSSWNTKLFRDRGEAGKLLAKQLEQYKADDLLILALPRGGVVLGYELAKALNSPLDVIIVRKIGLPGHKEFGIGAIAEGNVLLLDHHIIDRLNLSESVLVHAVREEREELKRRVELYRKNKPLPDLKNKTVILVDDGLATGVTAKAAIQALKKLNPKKIIFASPVCAYQTAEELHILVNELICLAEPSDLRAIGLWYQEFEQVTDDEVLYFLKEVKKLNRFEANNEREQRRVSL